jgi:organic radical activating enzyme
VGVLLPAGPFLGLIAEVSPGELKKMKGKIYDIFDSVQGEGIYLGEKQLFVRFFGCNLSCKFCDTKLEYFKEYEPQELVGELQRYGEDYHSVAFTGGEPLLQKDFLKEVLPLLRESGLKHYLETNGTLPEALTEIIEFLDIVAMDLKLPSSTQTRDFWQTHRHFLKIAAQKEVFLKAVICHSTLEEDLKAALEMIKETHPATTLVLQPNSYEDDWQLRHKIKKFRQVAIEENIATCVIAQVHKMAGLK